MKSRPIPYRMHVSPVVIQYATLVHTVESQMVSPPARPDITFQRTEFLLEIPTVRRVGFLPLYV